MAVPTDSLEAKLTCSICEDSVFVRELSSHLRSKKHFEQLMMLMHTIVVGASLRWGGGGSMVFSKGSVVFVGHCCFGWRPLLFWLEAIAVLLATVLEVYDYHIWCDTRTKKSTSTGTCFRSKPSVTVTT